MGAWTPTAIGGLIAGATALVVAVTHLVLDLKGKIKPKNPPKI